MTNYDSNTPGFPESPLYEGIDEDFAKVALKAYPELMKSVSKLLAVGLSKDKIMSVVDRAGATPTISLLVEKFIDQQVNG